MDFVFVYITAGNKTEAKKIASVLLKKRLIACANFFPVNSLHWWKKRIEKEKEYILIAKTSEKNFEKVKKEIKKIHSYSIPCITKIKVEANKEFERWVRKEVR